MTAIGGGFSSAMPTIFGPTRGCSVSIGGAAEPPPRGDPSAPRAAASASERPRPPAAAARRAHQARERPRRRLGASSAGRVRLRRGLRLNRRIRRADLGRSRLLGSCLRLGSSLRGRLRSSSAASPAQERPRPAGRCASASGSGTASAAGSAGACGSGAGASAAAGGRLRPRRVDPSGAPRRRPRNGVCSRSSTHERV